MFGKDRPPKPPRTPAQDTERMRNVLAFLLVGAFISVLPVLTFRVIPAENKDTITYILGQLSGMATTVLGFYFVSKVGQDAADAKRAENTGKLADAVVAAAGVAPKPKAYEDMTVDELVAIALKLGVDVPDPMDEAVLRAALIAKRDGGST